MIAQRNEELTKQEQCHSNKRTAKGNFLLLIRIRFESQIPR